MEELLELPAPLLVAIALFAVVQIGVEVYAIVDIIRRPADRITGGNKILWVLLVVFVNLIGAIVYLVVGRKPAPAVDVAAAAPATECATNAADMLYGTPAANAPAQPASPRDGDAS